LNESFEGEINLFVEKSLELKKSLGKKDFICEFGEIKKLILNI